MTDYNFKYVQLSDTWGQRPHNEGGFYLDWSAEGIGRGRLSFVNMIDIDNPDFTKTICETEHMSEEFVKAAVKFWIDNQVKLVDI